MVNALAWPTSPPKCFELRLNYAALRWAGVQQRLMPWARRLGIGGGLALLVTAGGAGNVSSALAAMGGLAAWSVLPGLWLSQSAGLLVALLAYAAAAAAWGLMLSPWLLPARWLETERQLPIPRSELWRSDAAVASFALLPVWALQGLGALAWGQEAPPDLQGGPLLAGLLAANALGLALVTLGLQWRRALPRPSASKPLRTEGHATPPRRHLPAAWALLALPLLRGPWRRSRRWLSGASIVLMAPALLARPESAGAWMALWVLLAGIGVQRGAALLRDEGDALANAVAPLPLHAARWSLYRQALALLPLLPAALAWMLADLSWRPAVLAAFLPTLLLGGAWLALHRLQADEASAVRALLLLTALIALGTESLK